MLGEIYVCDIARILSPITVAQKSNLMDSSFGRFQNHLFCFFCKTGFALDLNIEMMLGIEMKFSKIHSIHIPLRQILLGAT